MALQVWLPLNGNLENKGLADITVTNSGAVVDNNGKIGKCYSFDGSDDSILIPFTSVVSNDFSISLWFYKTELSSKNYDTIFGGPSGFEIETRAGGSGTLPQIQVHNWGGGIIDYEFGKWNHLVMVRNSSETKWYLNGQLKLTGSAGSIPAGNYYIGAWRSYNEQNYKGKINDLRIYDHCLSQVEVKEISKGLVLHYPLNDGYAEPTTNFFNGSGESFSGWSSYGFGSCGVRSLDSSKPAISGETCRVTSNGSSTSNQNIEMATWAYGQALSQGQKVTLSAYVKGVGNTIGKTCFIHVYNSNGTNTQSDTVATTTLTSEWQRISGVFTWRNSNVSSTSFSCYVVANILKDEYFLFSNVQLELKDHATPYTPSSRNENVVYDCSGYSNNGILNSPSSHSSSSDFKRYDKSLFFDGGNSSIQLPTIPQFTSEGIFTMNVWFKKTDWGSKGYETIFGGPGGFELEAKSGGTNSPVLVAYNWGGGVQSHTN